MLQRDSVTVGLHQLLYGRQVPHLVLKHYKTTDDELYASLWSVPDTPEVYLSFASSIHERWEVYTDRQRLEQWIPPFFALPGTTPASFHPLCKFYRSYICCESRMIIQAAAVWTETLEMTLLKYELVLLQQHLIQLLKECGRRMEDAGRDGHTLQGRLRGFMLEVLWDHLIILLYELRDRYAHLLDERTVSAEELWIRHLHRPVPERLPGYRTEEHTEFHLEKALRGTGDLAGIEQLLAGIYRNYEQVSGREERRSLIRSVHRLENVWLCYRLCVETGKVDPAALFDAAENRRRIEQWLEEMPQQEAGDKRDMLFRLPAIIEQSRMVIHMSPGYHTSEAVRLLRELLAMLDPSAGRGEVKERSPAYAVSGGQQNGHGLLDELIPLDAIQEKLNVHLNTLNRYIEMSGVPIITFSAKNRWMHKDDYETFLAANKEKK